jgi:hypothetical protein
MSYEALLVHRATLLRLQESNVDGALASTWQPIRTALALRIDLSFSRRGKDPDWIAQAGRPSDRTGVAFFPKGSDVRPGDRIRVTKGPAGVFELQGSKDHVQGHLGDEHHIEVGVQEVALPLQS